MSHTFTLNFTCQVVLILVGLVGSGKSTFADALQEHFPTFRRCSQDELGDRRKVEDLARISLREGLSVCIDRTNINMSQRSIWISIAHERPGTEVWVITFETPYDICAERLRTRSYHPTINSPELALSVLHRFHSQYQCVEQSEGHDRELKLQLDNQRAHYTANEIKRILEQVNGSPKVPSHPPRWNNGRGTFRGQPSHRQFLGRAVPYTFRGPSGTAIAHAEQTPWRTKDTQLNRHSGLAIGGNLKATDAPWRKSLNDFENNQLAQTRGSHGMHNETDVAQNASASQHESQT